MPTGSQFCLYGSPIGNSPSPLLHNTAFQALGIGNRYRLFDTKDIKQVVISLRDRQTGGGSITMPHKQTIMPFLDEISAPAKAIGAVNTVSKDAQGRLLGDNTDWLAIYQLSKQRLADLGKGQGTSDSSGPEMLWGLTLLSPDANPVGLVVGAGGTAHAACYALTQLKSHFYIYNRTQGTLAKLEMIADPFSTVLSSSKSGHDIWPTDSRR